MSAEHSDINPSISLDRFSWVQDFAVRLAILGAPVSADILLRLAHQHYETRGDANAFAAAELVWIHWPTQPGIAGL